MREHAFPPPAPLGHPVTHGEFNDASLQNYETTNQFATGRFGWTADNVGGRQTRTDRSGLLGHRLRPRALARRVHQYPEIRALDRQGNELRRRRESSQFLQTTGSPSSGKKRKREGGRKRERIRERRAITKVILILIL